MAALASAANNIDKKVFKWTRARLSEGDEILSVDELVGGGELSLQPGINTHADVPRRGVGMPVGNSY